VVSARVQIAGLAAACALATAGLTGCTPQPTGPPVVVLFPGSEDDVWGASAEVLSDELEDDGYDVEVKFAGDDIPEQLGQLREALAAGPAAVVIAPVDATAVAAELGSADDPDVAIISYDRLVLDAPEVDYYATFDHRESGRLQAGALLDGLGLTDPTADAGAALAVELLAGSGDDPAAQEAFAGSLEVLQPYLDSGALAVPSGRVDLEQAAILRGKPSTAASRVAALLDDGVELAGVLSPSDAMSAAVAEVLAEAGLDVATDLGGWTAEPVPPPETGPPPPDATTPPNTDAEPDAEGGSDAADPGIRPVVLTGGGSTLDGAQAVADGTQTVTVYEDPQELARVVASMVSEVVGGREPTVTQGATTDNGARDVPTRLLVPLLVTAIEAAQLL
jgi:putative multiple sugar transport system substrate-binding protein